MWPCALLLLVAASGTASAAAPPTQIANRIVDAGMPGAVVLVRDRTGTRVGVAGYADLEARRRMTAAAVFRVGSVTKTMVATMVVQLAGQRKLRLGDSVEHWLPGRVPNGRAITIRHLLNHTSGLFDYSSDPRLFDAMYRGTGRAWAPSDLLAVATSHPPLFAPGGRWSYSSTNYIVLGLIVQAATKSTVEKQLARRIVRPLRLRRTELPTTARVRQPFAHGYLLPGAPGATGSDPFDTTRIGTHWAWAAGGVVSSVRDVARFYSALLRGDLLAPRLVAQMTKAVPTGGGSGYGLGLSRSRFRCGAAWGHNGSVPGYTTYVLENRSGGRQVVALVNGTPGNASQRTAVDSTVVDAFCSLR